MNAHFYKDIDSMIKDYNGFSLWDTLWSFAEAMWLTGHEDEDG